MIIDQEGVDEHEYGFWGAQCVPGFAFCFWFEVLDAIVGNIANGTPSESRDLWDLDISMVCELFLEYDSGVALKIFFWSSLDHS